MKKYDVIIIGGSLAGAACARELERAGIDAVAFERDRFPRRKVCGGFLSPGAVGAIQRLGLWDAVIGAGAVRVTSIRVRTEAREHDIPIERPAYGISRDSLDSIFARNARVEESRSVHSIRRYEDGFEVDGIRCSVVIDASGKLGRFTKRTAVDEFGIQYTEPTRKDGVMDFWFFEDAYGGAVSIEGARSNCCFLVKKNSLSKYMEGRDCVVTGPLAYDRLPGAFIAIGDAAGMVDPFCGDGMRHAIETGVLAARVVASGLRKRVRYEAMKYEYESRYEREWTMRRALGTALRPYIRRSVRFIPPALIHRMWD